MKITIEVPDTNTSEGTKIFLDGVQQEDVTRIAFFAEVHSVPYLRIDRFSKEDGRFVIDSDKLKVITEEYR